MPEILSLDAAKEHLRLDDEIEDSTVEGLVAAAIATLEDFLGRPLIDLQLGWASVEQLPANIVHAVKVILADLYENRDAPMVDEDLLRRLVGRHVRITFG